MKIYILSFVVIIFSFQLVICQQTINAMRTSSEILIDGQFEEPAWQAQTEIATSFISVAPKPNQTPSYQTEVKVIYDDEALYIAASMKEGSRDSIMQNLSLRDNFGANADFFGVIIDTYGNGTSAIELMVSAAGVQLDNKASPNNGDISWDAVWYSDFNITDDGWTVEMKIPYAVLRFPKQDVQSWNVNFFRKRTVDGSFHTWHNVDFEQTNSWLTQMGNLEGIKDIKTPVRLTLTPYASLYSLRSKDPSTDPSISTGQSYNYGLDAKLGLSDAYTLDMTLIPDFGQTISDDQVLNLSPFEVRFSENRAFFTEGIDLFNKAGIFYSRRIGQDQQLYNATKVSGRNKKGFALAVINAVAKKEAISTYNQELSKEVSEVVNPLTNYNILVFDQDLKNNSSVSLTNTNVTRRGFQFHNANVTASTFNLKNKAQSFGIKGRAAISQIINKASDNSLGHDFSLSLDKLNGSGVYGVTYEETSKSYDQNDLGFFTRGNERKINTYYRNRDFDGFGIFSRFNYWASMRYSRNIDPDSYSETNFNIGLYAETKSFFQFNIWGSGGPSRKNFFETRTTGRHFDMSSNYGGGWWFGTDFRKKLQLTSYGSIFNNNRDYGWLNASFGGGLRYRASNKMSVVYDLSVSKETNARGYVTHIDEDIIFGNRNVSSLTNKMNINYTLNNKMGFDIRLRHFWSSVNYMDFYNLTESGSLAPRPYATFKDFSFNAFTIDANYRWRFAPGSELIIVWKNNISGVLSDPTLNYGQMNYSDGISGLSSLPQSNSLSVRFSYFLDYNTQIKKLW